MSSQFVDINGDQHNDILVGSFSGVPYIITGSEEGYGEPEQILDAEGETVLIADFWNDDEDKWDKTDRCDSEGHCTSVSAVDWDSDGDLDLILGDYYGGRLFLRINEGTATEPAFATVNQIIEADGEPMVIEKGLAAPRIVDWNGDGLFDILCGGSKGGVYFYANKGSKSEPKFAEAEPLIESFDDPSNSFLKRVPAKDGQPLLPGSSYHIEPFDYDNDGDLDLLVGARCSWFAGPVKELTKEEKKQLKELKEETKKVLDELNQFVADYDVEEEEVEIRESEEYQKLIKEYGGLRKKAAEFDTNPYEDGDFVWLFRRK